MKKGKFTASLTKGKVSYQFEQAKGSIGTLVLAHGAGTDMQHPSMEDVSQTLLKNKISVFRFNFPYKEKGAGGPNPQKILLETIENAISFAQTLSKNKPLFAGGKSMGGRMTSILMAENPVPKVKGLLFFGFPLHAVGRPSIDRAEHLKNVKAPMLFLSGTRDTMGSDKHLREVVSKLPKKNKLVFLEGADHSYKVLKSGPVKYETILDEVGKESATFIKKFA